MYWRESNNKYPKLQNSQVKCRMIFTSTQVNVRYLFTVLSTTDLDLLDLDVFVCSSWH